MNVTDRQTTDGWVTAYSELELTFTFAKNLSQITKNIIIPHYSSPLHSFNPDSNIHDSTIHSHRLMFVLWIVFIMLQPQK